MLISFLSLFVVVTDEECIQDFKERKIFWWEWDTQLVGQMETSMKYKLCVWRQRLETSHFPKNYPRNASC